jgi:hypothetical protein
MLSKHADNTNIDIIINDLNKKIVQNVYNDVENVNNIVENVNNNVQNVNTSVENVNNLYGKHGHTEVMYKCPECYKEYKHKRYLTAHLEKCEKNKTPYECMLCKKVLSSRQALYLHKKNHCKGTDIVPYVPLEASAMIGTDPAAPSTSAGASTSAAASTINNGTLINQVNQVTTTNTNSNNNITINVFPQALESDFEINTDHMDIKRLKRNILNQTLYQAVGTSMRMVLENKDNLPVKKKNMRSNFSYVHVGDNKWEARNDSEVFGLISFHISRCIQVYLDGKNMKQLQEYYREATETLEFIGADLALDELKEEREVWQKAQRVMEVIKLGAYDRPDR